MKPHKGFTLIELMVVVTIIGILASIALPNYGNYIARAQVTEALTLAEDLKKAVGDYYKQTGRFPADNAAAGLPPADKLLGNYVQGIRLENGAMHVLLGNRVHQSLQDKILSLRPLYVPDSPASPISWLCGTAKAPQGMAAAGDDRTDVEGAWLPGPCRI